MKLAKINTIKSNPQNPRTIKDDKFKKLVESLRNFPEMANVRPIVVNQDMVVLGGNMRLKAMKEAGWKDCPIEVVDWPEAKQREFIIKDNVGFGDWDWDTLGNEWDSEPLEDWGLDVPGFDMEVEAEEDDFEAPEGGIETDIVLGDLFEIGEHRLLCGDSTDSEAVAKLMDGQKADLLLTDPPYGIGYAGSMALGQKRFGWKQHKGGWDEEKPDNGVLQYLCEITDKQIIWGGNYFTDNLPPTMGWLIWDKGQRDFSLADGEMAWTSFDNALRILSLSRAEANREEKNHATQKPVKLIIWCFEYADRHSKEEIKLVLDAYLGSGTTMVASHQLKRKCYGMELDPKYCQVIVDRMRKLDASIEIKKNGEPYKNNELSTNG
jgi:site-specific DNA-methyltransferase (adenine-specific)